MFCSWATDYEQRDRWSLSIYYVDVDGKRVHDRPSDLMADVPEPGPQLLSCLTPADPSVRYVRLHFDIQIQLIAWMSDVYDCVRWQFVIFNAPVVRVATAAVAMRASHFPSIPSPFHH